MGNPWFDLAVIVCGDALDEADGLDLLEAWLQRPAQERDQLCLRQQLCLARYLEWLWYAAVQPPGLQREAQQQVRAQAQQSQH